MKEHADYPRTSDSRVAVAVRGFSEVAYFLDSSSAFRYSRKMERIGQQTRMVRL